VDEKNTPVKKEAVMAARASAWQYRFTTPQHRGETGAWWTREYLGRFASPVER
jgi:hypothetical protein